MNIQLNYFHSSVILAMCDRPHNVIMYRNFTILIIFICILKTQCMTMEKSSFDLNSNDPESDIVEFIESKGYLPKEKDLPKSVVINKHGNDTSYILSKLSDEELLKLLNTQPLKETYDISDVANIALGSKTIRHATNKQEKTYSDNNKNVQAFYKLDHKEVLPQNQKPTANFLALKKLHNLLYTRPRQGSFGEVLNEQKRELLFDILVAQLKKLCCKAPTNKIYPTATEPNVGLLDTIIKSTVDKTQKADIKEQNNNEFMFLILNEEIKSKENGDIVLVNPDSLDKNSSVLLLGPLTTPLTDEQLKIVMNRVSNELMKPEYTSFLQKLSDGTLNESNLNVLKSFISGPDTRRYIKAHRCNHQSKLARVYGGPKWLICTGYLNLNKPSLYD